MGSAFWRENPPKEGLGGPLDTRHAEQVHNVLRASNRPIVGFTSYKRFPIATKEMAERYLAECAGWCHCFRDATAFAPAPTIELSHSDLTDVDYVNPRTFANPSASWDYAYVCLPGREVEKAKAGGERQNQQERDAVLTDSDCLMGWVLADRGNDRKH